MFARRGGISYMLSLPGTVLKDPTAPTSPLVTSFTFTTQLLPAINSLELIILLANHYLTKAPAPLLHGTLTIIKCYQSSQSMIIRVLINTYMLLMLDRRCHCVTDSLFFFFYSFHYPFLCSRP